MAESGLKDSLRKAYRWLRYHPRTPRLLASALRAANEWRAAAARSRWLNHVRIRANYFLGGRGDVFAPVLILSTARSGSNLLLRMLNSVEHVCLAGEVLNPGNSFGIDRSAKPEAALRHVFYSAYDRPRGSIGGAKLLLEDMRALGIGVSQLASILPTARFIILYRESLLEQYVSLQIAAATGIWKVETAAPAGRPHVVAIDPEDFREFCESTRQSYEEVLGFPGLAARSSIVCYEDLARDPERYLNERILPFLDLPPAAVKPPLRKQRTR
ncbi:MAG TPA: sulfotransferase, partial [Elusimicrobiota bacterium]|nr:sulfotransferase [Elusimicrobiota bacterium]